MTTTTDTIKALRDALRKAYNFGQTYWQQADSEYLSQQRKSNETADKFAAFVDETCATLTADASEDAPDRLDPVVEANRALLHERSQVGIKKYGVTLGEANLSERDLLVHALQEALDLSNYLQANLQRVDAARAVPVAATPAPDKSPAQNSMIAAINDVFAQKDRKVAELQAMLAAAPAAPTSPPVTPKHIEQIKDILLWPVTEDDARTARDMLQSLHFDLSMAEQDPAPAAPIVEEAAVAACRWTGGACDCTRAMAQRCDIIESRMPGYRPAAEHPGRAALNEIIAESEEIGKELAAIMVEHAKPAENWIAHNPQELDEMLSRIPGVAHAKLAEGASTTYAWLVKASKCGLPVIERGARQLMEYYEGAEPDLSDDDEATCSLSDSELADPIFTRAYIESCNHSFALAMSEIKRLRGQQAGAVDGEASCQ